MNPARRNIFVLSLFVILSVLISGCASQSQVTYKVSGTVAEALVEYKNSEGKKVQETVKLPWSMSFNGGKDFSFELYVVNTAGTGEITCEVTADKNSIGSVQASKYAGCTGSFSKSGGSFSSHFKGYDDIFPPASSLPHKEAGGFLIFASQKFSLGDLVIKDLNTGAQMPLTDGLGGSYCITQSPAASLIALTSERGGTTSDIYIFDIDAKKGEELTNLTASPDQYEMCPSWSSDGKNIAYAFTKKGGIWQIGVKEYASGNFTQLTQGEDPSVFPAWSPDGKKIAYVSFNKDGAGVYVMNSDGTGAEPLTETYPSSKGNVPLTQLAWSADGKHLAYFYHHDSKVDLIIISASGAEEKKFPLDARKAESLKWDSESKQIVYHAWKKFTEASDIYSIDVESGKSTTLADGSTLDFVSPFFSTGESLSKLPTSPIKISAPQEASKQETPAPAKNEVGFMLFTTSKGELQIIDGKIGKTRYLTEGLGKIGYFSISPVEPKIAYTLNKDIYVLNVGKDGDHTPVNITNTEHYEESAPEWSKDGKKITFDQTPRASTKEKHNIISVNADGSNPVALFSMSAWNNAFPVWSPDGKKIAISVRDNNMSAIYLIDPDGSNPTKISQDFPVKEKDGSSYISKVAWSPDGQKIAFFHNHKKTSDFIIMNINGEIESTTPLQVTFADLPAWDTNGQWVAFNARPEGIEKESVYLINIADKNIEELLFFTNRTGFVANPLVISPDFAPMLPTSSVKITPVQ